MIYNLTSANTRDYVKTLAEKLQIHDHIFLIGRGLQYPTALEAALKIKEVSYIHAEGTHDDRFWALALAVYAAETQTPEMLFRLKKDDAFNALQILVAGVELCAIMPSSRIDHRIGHMQSKHQTIVSGLERQGLVDGHDKGLADGSHSCQSALLVHNLLNLLVDLVEHYRRCDYLGGGNLLDDRIVEAGLGTVGEALNPPVGVD